MYLRGFPVVSGNIQQIGSDPDACRAAGGVPYVISDLVTDFRTNAIRREWGCRMPSGGGAASGGNVTVTVPTTTTVSPQISPQFIQQQQPENSPIGAGIQRDTNTSTQGVSEDYLQQLAAERDAYARQALEAQSYANNPSPYIVPETTVSADASRQAVQDGEVVQPMVSPLMMVLAALGIVGTGVLIARKQRSTKRRSKR